MNDAMLIADNIQKKKSKL